MRWTLAAIFLILGTAAAAAQGCGPTNPNCVVPTAPSGTADNRAASTAFISGQQVQFAAGSAAVPSLVIGGTTAGFYFVNQQGGGIGISANNLQAATIINRSLPYDNVWLRLGTGQAITTSPSDTYVATIATPSVNQSGVSQYIGLNIGTVGVNATDTVTKTGQQAMVEMDKIDFTQSGGAVTYSSAVQTRFRFAWAHAGVTITKNAGIDFVPPDGSLATGTVVDYVAVNIPSLSAAGGYSGTNFYGLRCNNALSGGCVSSIPGTDLNIFAASGTGGAGNLVLSALNGGVAKVVTGGNEVMRWGTATSTNYILVQAGSTPEFRAQGGTNVGFIIASHGSSPVTIKTNDTVEQMRISHTANAVNVINVFGGATGLPAAVKAQGTDADVSLNLATQGAGTLQINGTVTLTTTKTPTGACSLTFTSGLLTATTC